MPNTRKNVEKSISAHGENTYCLHDNDFNAVMSKNLEELQKQPSEVFC